MTQALLDQIDQISRVAVDVNARVAGGAARFLYAYLHDGLTLPASDTPGDIDVWLLEPAESTGERLQYLYSRLRGLGYTKPLSEAGSTKSKVVFTAPPESGGVDVQIIGVPDPDMTAPGTQWRTSRELVESFTLSAEQFYVTLDGRAEGTASAVMDLERGQITAMHYHNPVRTLVRLLKYSRKGYRIPVSEMRKVLDAYAALSDVDRERMISREY